MSEITEETLARYVDGESDAEETRRVEAHLIASRESRALLLALREEADLLAAVLRERPARAPALARAEVPDPGLSVGLPVAVGAFALALAVGSTLLRSGLPAALDFLNPLHLKGALAMLFNVFFLVRDQAPDFFDLLVAVAATGSVAALGAFAVSALSRRLLGRVSLVLLVLGLLALPARAPALELRLEHHATQVAAGETLDQSLVATGESVDIDGVVRGDVFAAADRVTVRGTVEGDLYVFAGNVDISGSVAGSAHIVAETGRIGGRVHGSVIWGGDTVSVAAGSRLGRDAGLFGATVLVDGTVGRDLIAAADSVDVRGDVGRNLQVLAAEQVALLETARVGGDVTARLPEGTEVELAPGARVAGAIHTEVLKEHAHGYLEQYRRPGLYVLHAIGLGASFLLGLLLYVLVPRLFASVVPTARAFFRSLGYGFVVALVTPVAILLAALTLVGIPIAVLALFLYLSCLYFAHILVGALVGRALLRPGDASLGSFGRRLLLGLAVVLVATHIPFLGPPVALVVLFFGLGLVVQRGRALAARVA
jgi:cytoskeletal protein CcmA (bactofilin family)